MSKNLNLLIKGCLLVLLTVGLLAGSCKKSSPSQQAAAPAPEQKDVEVPKPQEAPAQQPAPETKEKSEEAPKPVETPASEPNKADANAVKMVPLDIKLPKAVFIGTPQMVTVPNMEKVTGELRKPFYAPEGTTNVALNKPVTSNQEPIIGELSMVTDGDKEGSDGSFVEFPPGVNRITIDLGAEYNIYAIVIWHYHQQARVYFDVIVQVADDPDFVTNVKTLFNNDIDNTAGQGVGKDKHYIETFEGRLIDAKGVKARYVRLYSNGNSSNEQNHYTEVEVYGKPAQ